MLKRERGGISIGVGFGFIIIILAILFFPSMLDAFDRMGQAEATTISAEETTGTGEAEVTLGSDLIGDNTDNVLQITSTNNADNPAPSSYAHSTKVLTVNGLEAVGNHTLSVTYLTEREDDFLSSVLPVAPVLIFVFWLAAGGLIIYRSW